MGERRILLVEDDDDLRGLMRRHLSGRGYQILEANTVAAACRVLGEGTPDLLVLDIGLPDGSGWEVARYLRGRNDTVPIVVCSSQEPSTEEMAGNSIEGYLSKPFDLRSLVERLESALDSTGEAFAPVADGPPLEDQNAHFYSSLAHDMRTPMATLRTAVESLIDDDLDWDAEAQREFLHAIAASAERVGRYARDVVDMARIEAGALRPRFQRVEASETVEALLRSSQRALRCAAPLSVSVPNDAPLVRADPVLVHRILAVLLENAIQYTPGDGRISLTVIVGPDDVRWCIADTGPGVPAAQRERIFERDFRIEGGRSARTGGPRISLYLATRLSALQDGRLWVDDAEGGGAAFWLALPRA